MDGSLLLWGGLALCVFWGVGVHNRLMRIRARGLSALGSAEKHVRVYADLAHEVMTSVPAGGAHPQTPVAGASLDGWARLQSAWQALDQAWKDAKPSPLAVEPLARVAQAFDHLQDAWRQLNDVPPDLAGPVVPATLRTQWEAITQRVETARGGFNQISILYNEALDQFPASLVVRFMGFQPSGRL
ncbi:MAG: LemA family protein [Pseudomonadota bacterium]